MKIESVAVVEPAIRTFGSLLSRSSVSRQPPEQPAVDQHDDRSRAPDLRAPVSATAGRPGRVKVGWPAAMAVSKAATMAAVWSITGPLSWTKRGSACIRPRVSAYQWRLAGRGAIGDGAGVRLAADGELRCPDAVGQAIATRASSVDRGAIGRAQIDDRHPAARAWWRPGPRPGALNASQPASSANECMWIHGRPLTVSTARGRRRRHVDGGAVGRFHARQRRRPGLVRLEVAGSPAADL